MKALVAALCAVSIMMIGDDAIATEPYGDDVIAVDVLLLPDATMQAAARSANEKLRHDYAAGFTFDRSHVPHITLVQCYVRGADLAPLTAAVARVFAEKNPVGLSLTATGYFDSPLGELSAAGISIDLTPTLRELQSATAQAAARFALPEGSVAAFVDSPHTGTATRIAAYVAHFATEASGTNYRPHVTAGVVHPGYAASLSAGSFAPFDFRTEGAGIYQLGDVGTARKLLWRWHGDEPPQTPAQP